MELVSILDSVEVLISAAVIFLKDPQVPGSVSDIRYTTNSIQICNLPDIEF